MILFTTINAGGNITSAKTYPYTTDSISGSPLSQKTYSYSSSGWKDLLTNFNGDSIIYDEIGNPTQYRDGMTFDWESGRRLASITQGTNSYSYSYDSSGVRISKTVNGTTYSYIYDNGLLIYADTPSGSMTFFYENDSVAGYKYGPEYYYYIKNLQGDIIGVIDKNCNLLYQYEYDAWGNHTVLDAQGNTISPAASHIANSNPLRYRGYFFDTETGFYYLLSRYYDPATCRFINADGYIKTPGSTILATNMFSYCENNPIIRIDPTGEWSLIDDFIAGTVGAVVGFVSQVVSDVVTSVSTGSLQLSSWETYVGSTVGGFMGGVATLYTGPIAGSAIGSGASTLIGQTLENATGREKRSASEIVGNTLIDASISAIVGKAAPVKIANVTKGRNNMSAVFSSGLTKINNKTASKMSSKVIAKGVVSGIISDIHITIALGIRGAITINN